MAENFKTQFIHILHSAFEITQFAFFANCFHIGASLKDLGKKLFAFSRMEIKANEFFKTNNYPKGC
jgi:hypothetical protein